jgi:lysozyme
MKVSNQGLIEIMSHEAIVLSPYKDSVGVWTIFVGHTAKAGDPNPARLTKGVEQPMSEAIKTFRKDIAKFEQRVNKAVKVDVSQSEFDALVSFDYNTGGIHRASLTKALNSGDRARAAELFMLWKKPKQIIKRRQKEMRLFRDGNYSNNGFVSVYPASVSGRINWKKGRRINAGSIIADLRKSKTSPPAKNVGIAKAQVTIWQKIRNLIIWIIGKTVRNK